MLITQKNGLTMTLFKNVIPAAGLLILLFSMAATAQSKQVKITTKACDDLLIANVITANNPIPCHRLRRVSFSYWNEKGVVKNDGELLVLDIIAPQIVKLTNALLVQKFMIAKARGLAHYHGDDNALMNDNNSSAFNGRAITRGNSWSLHVYGVAIDVNPLQNPFIEIAKDGTAKISPTQSARYAVNRLNSRPGKKKRQGMAEDVVDLFARHGFFVWGGDWNYPIDDQHFQIGSRKFVEKLVALEPKEAIVLLNRYIDKYTACTNKLIVNVRQDSSREICVENLMANTH
jgi:hypothetical protein